MGRASVALVLGPDSLQKLFAVFLLGTGMHLLWRTRPRANTPVSRRSSWER